jgi:hypothetical protein
VKRKRIWANLTSGSCSTSRRERTNERRVIMRTSVREHARRRATKELACVEALSRTYLKHYHAEGEHLDAQVLGLPLSLELVRRLDHAALEHLPSVHKAAERR